ncbi:MAG: DUF4294 domain-containing protein [Bacteroidota bacterium]
MKNALLFILVLLSSFDLLAQNKKEDIIARVIIIDGDSVPLIDLPQISIYAERVFKNQREKARYTKLIRDVKKVYPYAKLAGIKINQYNSIISKIQDKKQREIQLKIAEEELKKEFKGEILKMTFSQGKILIKLIDRETGNTSFEIIKQLRGGLQAFLWQSLAKMFGNNLKENYDPAGDDKMIEDIVLRIENGDL